MLKKSFILLVLFSLSACISSKNNQPNEIRIVDLNGNPKPVQRFVPEGNAQILSNQNQVVAMQNISAPAPETIRYPSSQNVEVANLDQPGTENKKAAQNLEEVNVEYDMSGAAEQPEFKPEAAPEVKTENIQTISEPIQTNKKFKVAIGKISSSKAALIKQKDQSEDKTKGGIFIQIGSFSIASNADQTLQNSKNIFKGKISEVANGEGKSYRVVLGPISTSKKAKHILAKARQNGYKDAFIVK